MIPLRLVEKEHDDFDEPVVELWRDNDFVGHIFWDDDLPVVQFHLDAEGDPFDLDLRDVQRILEMADQIVSPDAFSDDELDDLRGRIQEAAQNGEVVDDVVGTLAEEFDERAAFRNSDGEGFFPKPVALELVARCDDLDVAVVEMEGFDLENGALIPRPNLNLLIRGSVGDQWQVFRPEANLRASSTMTDWPGRSTIVVAFVVQLPNGESVVM